jgi:dihydroflavonol-4-reductase
MKILVTGGTGFIGSHLVERLIEKGHDVRCFVRKSSNLRWLKDLKVELFNGSFYDESSLKEAVSGIDSIYHIAGAVMAKTPQGYFQSNQIATKNLLEACIKNNKDLKRFIYVSSGTVTGPSPDGKPITEDMPCNPITNYGRSKYAAEIEVIKCKKEFPITIVRPSAVYGPHDEAIYQYFKAVNSGLISLIGFSDKFVSLVHSTDLVDGILLAGESEKAIGQTYFIGSENFYSWKVIGATAKKVCGRKTLTLRIPHFLVYAAAGISQVLGYFSAKGAVFNIEKAKDFTQSHWIFSVEKAKKELGFVEKITLEDGFRDTIEWYKKNNWLK